MVNTIIQNPHNSHEILNVALPMRYDLPMLPLLIWRH